MPHHLTNIPGFNKALAMGEQWAVDLLHEDLSTKKHPERTEDGKPRKWCSRCPHLEGCISCDLD